MHFFTGGVLHWLNIIFGVPGNILIIVLMVKDKETNQAAKLTIITLAIIDCFVLLSFITLHALPSVLHMYRTSRISVVISGNITIHIYLWQYPFAIMTKCMSIYTVLCMAITRYITVCWPFKAARWCTLKRTLIQLIGFYIAAVSLHMPDFFEYYVTNYPFPMATSLAMDEAFKFIICSAFYHVLHSLPDPVHSECTPDPRLESGSQMQSSHDRVFSYQCQQRE